MEDRYQKSRPETGFLAALELSYGEPLINKTGLKFGRKCFNLCHAAKMPWGETAAEGVI